LVLEGVKVVTGGVVGNAAYDVLKKGVKPISKGGDGPSGIGNSSYSGYYGNNGNHKKL
jgi:hypothetical protein